MKQIIVLGSGCAKCVKTAEYIQNIADESNIPIKVVKETSLEVIMSFGVMNTPAIVIDNKVVHSGSIPDEAHVKSWLK
jgi:thiol-disulfide isomerase/thioredoxin